jgi:UDP-glucose 4-epimerase
MKILITGKNGYIAKSLIKALSSNHNITAIGREDFNLTCRESTNKFFKEKYFDVIIHTAIAGGSRLKKDDGDTFYQNIQMFYNLLNNKHCFHKLLSFGSGAELDIPNNPYGLSKNVISKIINNEDNFYNIRIYAVFDENELNTRFIKSNIKRYINKEYIEIHQNKLMDFFYMEDLIKVVEHFIYEVILPKNIDCTYGKNNSLLDIAYIINNLDNHKVEIKIKESRGDMYVGNCNPLNIKWVGLAEGIKKTYKKLLDETN